jgi:hypothetical protein
VIAVTGNGVHRLPWHSTTPWAQLSYYSRGASVISIHLTPAADAASQVVQISLPLLGVPASSIEITFQKTEKITIKGYRPSVTIDEVGKCVLWDNAFLAKGARDVRTVSTFISMPGSGHPLIAL